MRNVYSAACSLLLCAGIVLPVSSRDYPNRPVVQRLHQEIVRTLAHPEVKERMAAAGAQIVGGSPAEMASFLKQESARWAPLIKAVGIRYD